MKQIAISFCSVLMMLLLTGFSIAQQADTPTQEATPQMDHSAHSAPADDAATQAAAPIQHEMMSAMLEQMAAELSQENVTPETVKKVADQLKQLAEQHKNMPMMSGMGKQGGMMKDMSMMKGMGMMKGKEMGMMKGGKCKMMGGGDDSKSSKMDMMSMMPMERDPKMIQMRGEMMKAMGEIMMKYGQQMEMPSPQQAPSEQSAPTDMQHNNHQ